MHDISHCICCMTPSTNVIIFKFIYFSYSHKDNTTIIIIKLINNNLIYDQKKINKTRWMNMLQLIQSFVIFHVVVIVAAAGVCA